MQFSDEQLIAFLLGDADQHLAESIRICLPSDTELVERVEHFRLLLNHLDQTAESFEPPSNLLQDTMERIDRLADPEPVDLPASTGSTAESVPVTANSVLLSRPTLTSSNSRLKLADSLALTVGLAVLCCLTLPAVVKARYFARRTQCADNLRQTGWALMEYANRNPENRFPSVARSGPQAFAGVFAIKLSEAGLLPSTVGLRCVGIPPSQRFTVREETRLPTLMELDAANENQLELWRQCAGGDYAYCLGVIEDNQLVAPSNNGSSHFAILSDSALFGPEADLLVAHEGQGINVLYEDGQVRFLCRSYLECGDPEMSVDDHPFRNVLGTHEAGVGHLDASLAPSRFPPVSHNRSPAATALDR